MKKLITSILILVSLASFGQDTTKIKQPADSLEFISKINLVEFNKYLRKIISYEDYLKITPDQVINKLYEYAVLVWDEKKKKKN